MVKGTGQPSAFAYPWAEGLTGPYASLSLVLQFDPASFDEHAAALNVMATASTVAAFRMPWFLAPWFMCQR